MAAALTIVAVAGHATAAEPDPDGVVTYACALPPAQEQAAATCDGWHTGPVQLFWGWKASYLPVPTASNGCQSPNEPELFETDTAGTRVECLVTQSGGLSDPHSAAVTIQIDTTQPKVTGFTAERPPDHDGWWNHPVSLQFNGTDATSGIARCDVVAYGGPDGESAPVAGGCRDVAGNSASATFPIKYDATPPGVVAGPAEAAGSHVTINWMTSPDALATRIVRSPGIGTASTSEIYAGPGHTFTDPGVTWDKTYTYTLMASDAAANTATASINVSTPRPPPPRLHWRRVKRADYYNVQLFRGSHKILSRWPHMNHLQLRRSWKFRGRKRTLAAGSYQWYVWPGFGPRSKHRYGKLIAHRRFKIAPAQAAR